MQVSKSLIHLRTFQNQWLKPNYNKTVSRIKKVVKTVAEETMDDAAKEILDSAASTDDTVDTSV